MSHGAFFRVESRKNSALPDKLSELYPTHDDYVDKYTKAADNAVADGFLLQADRDTAVEQAKQAPIPK